jgi:hypothetical protein
MGTPFHSGKINDAVDPFFTEELIRVPFECTLPNIIQLLSICSTGLSRDYLNKVTTLATEVTKIFSEDSYWERLESIPNYSARERQLIQQYFPEQDTAVVISMLEESYPEYKLSKEAADKMVARLKKNT